MNKLEKLVEYIKEGLILDIVDGNVTKLFVSYKNNATVILNEVCIWIRKVNEQLLI